MLIFKQEEKKKGREETGTFICILIKASKCVYLIVSTIRHRGIDQTCWNMAQTFFDSRPVNFAASLPTFAGKHDVGVESSG